MKLNKNITIIIVGLVIILLITAVFVILNIFYDASPNMYKMQVSKSNLSNVKPLMKFLEINDIKSVEQVNMLTASNKADSYEITVSYTSKDGSKKEEITNFTKKSIIGKNDVSESVSYIIKNSDKQEKDKVLNPLRNISLCLLAISIIAEIIFIAFLVIRKKLI